MKRIIFIFFIIFSSFSYSLDFTIGIGESTKTLDVYEKDSTNEIAVMSKTVYYPVLGLRSEPKYFNDGESNAGYFIESDFSILNINTQETPSYDEKNLGTKIEGFSIYIIPTFYYNFFKNSTYSLKLGAGIGIGYLNVKGNYKVTEQTNSEYNSIKTLDINNFDLASSLLIDYSYENHHIIIQDFAIDHSGYEIDNTETNNYDYMQHNLSLMYKYFMSFN